MVPGNNSSPPPNVSLSTGMTLVNKLKLGMHDLSCVDGVNLGGSTHG